MMKSVLVIKLGALGDIIHSCSAFSTLRRHHQNDYLIALTTKPYAPLLTSLGYFDEVQTIDRFPWWDLYSLRNLLQFFKTRHFDWVYDLQGVDRTRFYRHLYLQNWRGHKQKNWISWDKGLNSLHPLKRFALLFEHHNIPHDSKNDLRFLASHSTITLPPSPYVMIVPGASSAHHGQKRWPLEGYQQLAIWLISQQIHVVIVGTAADGLDELSTSLAGDFLYDYTKTPTTIADLLALAQKSNLAIGNDTGPMIIADAGGCVNLTLYNKTLSPGYNGGGSSNLAHCIEVDNLNLLQVKTVIDTIKKIIF